MVKFLIILILPVFLLGGEFTASVNSTEVDMHEGFSLNLTMKDASPKDAPAISTLNKHFTVHSEQHSSNTTIINGKASSSITWSFFLTPKVEGALEIPPITINTAEGPLSTQEISLTVIKGANDAGLNISAKASNASPYKNEPIVYTFLLTSKMPLYNVQTEKLQLEDAIVELIGQPKMEEKVIEGVLQKLVEFSYLITPLKAGSLIIPSIAIHGAAAKQRNGRHKPFTLTSEEIHLDVQPALAEVSPWLAAKALTLEEERSNDQTFRVGEPFSRKFLIKAEGLKASQIPHLQQSHGSTVKVYADKPEEEEKVIQDALHSMRKEHYTLIPQEAGTLVLPEISINWWDSASKEKRTTTLAARTLQVLPAIATEKITSTPLAAAAAESPPYFLYGIIAILTFFLASALLWAITLQRKIASLTKEPSKPKKSQIAIVQKEKKEKLPDLNPT